MVKRIYINFIFQIFISRSKGIITIMPKEKDYYTAGELAELFNIQKQTLLYYDKVDLLHPEYISENGYRHYSMKQYMLLEIILNLRKLDIPISVIKEYINNRSTENFEKLLASKQAECNALIEKCNQINTTINGIMRRIDSYKKEPVNVFTLQYLPPLPISITNITTIKEPKERINIYAKHNIDAFANEHFKDKSIGWIISYKDYAEKSSLAAYAYFSTINKCCLDNMTTTIRSEGLYLVKRITGTLYNQKTEIIQGLIEFMDKNALEPIGDIYCLPLKDHWMTENTEEYILQISIMVKYKD